MTTALDDDDAPEVSYDPLASSTHEFLVLHYDLATASQNHPYFQPFCHHHITRHRLWNSQFIWNMWQWGEVM